MNLKRWFRPFKALRGGAFLHEDADSGHRDFRPLPGDAPTRLRVPLDTEADVIASAGERVHAGQCIARGPGRAVVHAPLAGTVQGQTTVSTPFTVNAPAVEIALDPAAEDRPAELLEGQLEAAPESRSAFIERMREAGVDVGGLGDFVEGAGPRTVIVCGLDLSPPQTCHTQLLFRYGPTIIETAAIIHRLFGVQRTYLAVDRAHGSLVRACTRRSRGTPVRVAALANKYPQAHAHLLVRTITRRAIAPGGSPRDVGVVVLDAAHLVDGARALRDEPVTHRMLSVAGPGLREPGNYRVPIGISVGEVLAAVGASYASLHVAANCLYSGPAIEDRSAVITRQTRAILTCVPAGTPDEAPCIRCGYCQDVCPVELDPLAMLRAVERDRVPRAAQLFPRACLACGLCDHVCPAQLPLMRAVIKCGVKCGDRSR